jgi:hypothetical protein
MRIEDLKNEKDHEHARREENRHRVRTYQDKFVQRRGAPVTYNGQPIYIDVDKEIVDNRPEDEL